MPRFDAIAPIFASALASRYLRVACGWGRMPRLMRSPATRSVATSPAALADARSRAPRASMGLDAACMPTRISSDATRTPDAEGHRDCEEGGRRDGERRGARALRHDRPRDTCAPGAG